MQIQEKNIGKDPEKIHSMFSKVANQYDRANQILSLGIHHIWRKKLVSLAGGSVQSILDCATGTGDLAIEFKKAHSSAKVIGTDFCADMLKTAPEKAKKLQLDISFQVADAMNLPFQDNQFDVATISFGIRNVGDPLKALNEMSRVVKPGGKVMVLEFGQVDFPVFASIYNFYSNKVLPMIGGWVTGERDAYQYLQKSSAEFPCKENFLQLMHKTNAFSACEYHTLTGGIAYIYVGSKKLSSNT